MLHIVSGYSVGGALRHARVPGEVAVWHDPLYAGPTPSGVEGEEWRRLRAEFLMAAYDIPLGLVGEEMSDPARERLERNDAVLERFSDHDEVVLWLAAGLPDQLHLVRHLDWFAGREHGATRIRLICIGDFPSWPGRIRGLGVLGSEQLATLLPLRHEVTGEEYDVARRAWAAYRSPDPCAIADLLERDTSALPYLHDAFAWHIRRFPSTRNGLGHVQNECLAHVPRRATEMVRVVGTVLGTLDEWLDGFYFAWVLEGLSQGRAPAVTIGEAPPHPDGGTYYLRAPIALTHVGRDLLGGRADWVRLNGIDRWLGGAHLQGDEAAWRWDEEARRLTAYRSSS